MPVVEGPNEVAQNPLRLIARPGFLEKVSGARIKSGKVEPTFGDDPVEVRVAGLDEALHLAVISEPSVPLYEGEVIPMVAQEAKVDRERGADGEDAEAAKDEYGEAGKLSLPCPIGCHGCEKSVARTLDRLC